MTMKKDKYLLWKTNMDQPLAELQSFVGWTWGGLTWKRSVVIVKLFHGGKPEAKGMDEIDVP